MFTLLFLVFLFCFLSKVCLLYLDGVYIFFFYCTVFTVFFHGTDKMCHSFFISAFLSDTRLRDFLFQFYPTSYYTKCIHQGTCDAHINSRKQLGSGIDYSCIDVTLMDVTFNNGIHLWIVLHYIKRALSAFSVLSINIKTMDQETRLIRWWKLIRDAHRAK